MELSFITKKVGLDVTFRNQSTEVPVNTSFIWDFGDGTDLVTEVSPTHTYQEEGFYTITLTAQLTTPQPEPGPEPEPTPEEPKLLNLDVLPKPQTVTSYLVLSKNALTTLSGSIYTLINHYIPTNIVGMMPFSHKQTYIEKWQLFIQPLVNHTVELEDYNDELHYEALENQLVMEAAALDYLTTTLTNLLQAKSNTQSHEETDNTGNGEESQVKKITTGPTEVEFHDQGKTSKDIVANAIKAMQPGGILDTLRKNLCTLSSRLDIILPFCRNFEEIFTPSIGQRRNQSGLRGPNPTIPIR